MKSPMFVHDNRKGGIFMEKNTYKSQRKNSPKNERSNSQPEPMSGSHKVKKKNHVSQTDGEG